METRLLSRIASGMDASILGSLRLGQPPEGFTADPAIGATGTAWLYVTVKAPYESSAVVKASWQADLIAGAYRDLSHASGLPDLLGYSISVDFPDGRVLPAGASLAVGDFEHGAGVTNAASLTDVITQRLTTVSAQVGGFSSTKVSFVQPAGLAPVVVIRANDPGEAAEYFASMFSGRVASIFGSAEGGYLEIRDAHDRIVLAASGTARIRKGRVTGAAALVGPANAASP
jgi:hypothetical protein